MVNIQHLRADYLIKNFVHLPSLPLHPELFRTIGLLFLITSSLAVILHVIRKVLAIRYSLTQPTVLLELTPPAKTEKTAYTTQQLFGTLHDLSRRKTFMSHLTGQRKTFSFEIVSTKEHGIRYVIRVDKLSANTLKHHLLSYLPQVRVKEVEDYLPKQETELDKHVVKIVELKLSKHFAYPLQKQSNLEEHDPVAYITGMMTKLTPGELLAIQIVVSPSTAHNKEKIKSMIYRGEDVLGYLDKFRLPQSLNIIVVPLGILIKGMVAMLSLFAGAFKTVVNDFADAKMAARQAQLQYQMQYAMQAAKMNIRPARSVTPFEQQAIESIEQKIEQKVFQTQIRLLMVLNEPGRIVEREHGFLSSLAMFTSVSDQGFQKKFLPNIPLIRKYLYVQYRSRLLSLVSQSSPTLLSVSEISDLYHFPFSSVTQTENIVKVHSRELPAPVSLKNGTKFDVVVGNNTYAGVTTAIGLTDDDRSRHSYLIGRTGSGKSTVLFHMGRLDILKGRGLCVVDPHGDLADDLLASVPEKRINDLIFLNPFDLSHPIGINLLELTPGLGEDQLELEKELVCESVISVFRRVFSQDEKTNAHRIEYMLRNTIYTAFTVKGCTIFTLYTLLTDPDFQKEVVSKLEDENLVNFWKNEFGKAGNYQIVKMIGGVTAKVGRFLFSPTAKRILEQEHSTINFNDILDNKKILLCNLSEGKLGEDTAQLLGITVITKIHQAALRRARMELTARDPFYLYVDEFQNFATQSFNKLLSGGRKFGLRITIAEQSTAQQDDRNIVNVILANTANMFCFQTASPMDEQLMLTQFSPYIESGDIGNLPRHHFYLKLSSSVPEEPFSGVTIPIKIKVDKKKIEKLIDASRKNYAIEYKKPEKKVVKPLLEKTPKKQRETYQEDIGLL